MTDEQLRISISLSKQIFIYLLQQILKKHSSSSMVVHNAYFSHTKSIWHSCETHISEYNAFNSKKKEENANGVKREIAKKSAGAKYTVEKNLF
jgi:hypothetical protein